MAQGELVLDEVVDAMMEEWLWQIAPQQGVLFDGFPRTIAQAQFLDELFHIMGRKLEAAIYLNLSDTEIPRRLGGRLICHTCQTPYQQQLQPPAQSGICDLCGGQLEKRDDDNPQTIRARLKTFHGQTAPLIQYYKAAGLLIEIDGRGEVAVVKERTVAVIRSLMQV
jgi:adenylate kinase